MLVLKHQTPEAHKHTNSRKKGQMTLLIEEKVKCCAQFIERECFQWGKQQEKQCENCDLKEV